MSWEKVSLGSICKIKTGKYDVNHSSEEGKYPFFTCAFEAFKADTFSFDGELIILPGNGANVGQVFYYQGKAEAYQRTYVLQDFDAFPKYLYYFLQYKWKRVLDNKQYGSATNYIRLNNITDLQIPLPPLHIQKQIANILDKADALRKKDQQLLQKYDELAQAIFIDMFGDPVKNEKEWEEMKCEDLFDMKLGKMLSAKNYKGTHLKKYLRNVNVKWGEIDTTDVKEMDFNEKEFLLYKLFPGDILVCEGDEVGRTAIFEDEVERCGYQKSLHRLRIKDDKKISNFYFMSYMKLAVAKGLIKKLTTSVTIQHFTLEKFRELEIIVPPISLQKKFEKMLMNIKKQASMHQKEIAEHLFQSLLQKAFTGELITE